MATLRLVASLALVTACYSQQPPAYSTMPEPVEVEGAPSGEIDPQWQASYVDDNSQGAIDASVAVSSDPTSGGYVMGACTDGEIDATLDGYGEWIYIEGYGEVWRPYTTAVGVNFTPYETCGSWVWTDWGWTFACEWDWGWLPFHYGRWGWFDDYWAWQPDYEWSPAWVDWRGGGGYVGWRPSTPIIRDHRNEHDGIVLHDHRHDDAPIVRDHRTARTKDWQWRFAANDDFGKPRIRAHLFKSPAEGLRVTSLVPRPPIRGTVQPVHAESIMRGRLATASRIGASRVGPSRTGPSRVEPDRGSLGTISGGGERPIQRPRTNASFDSSPSSPSVYQPTYQPPLRSSHDDRASVQQPPANEPSQELGGLPVTPTTPTPEPPSPPRAPTYTAPTAPSQPTYQPPTSHPPRAPTYTAPTPPSRAPDRSTYTPPTYSPPSRSSSPSYSPPSQPTYSPPSRSSSPSYSPPSHSSAPTYSPPSRSSSPSYSPPSAPSSSGGGGGGVRSHRR